MSCSSDKSDLLFRYVGQEDWGRTEGGTLPAAAQEGRGAGLHLLLRHRSCSLRILSSLIRSCSNSYFIKICRIESLEMSSSELSAGPPQSLH